MRTDDEFLTIGVNVLGVGQRPSAWQHDGLADDALTDVDHWVEVARTAERGVLDALFLADGPALQDPNQRPAGFLEPTVLWSAVAARTEHVGLIATASTTYNDPVELAERFLTLDHLSGGRIGWNAVTTSSPAAADNFGGTGLPDRETRYARAHESVDLVQKLWSSAVTGEEIQHQGRYFSFEGRLRTPASAQGFPVLVQAGGSPAGRRLAGERAEAVFTAEMTRALALEHYRDFKHLAADAGRDPRQVRILPGYALVLGSTVEEAERRYDDFEARGPDAYTVSRLSGILDLDVTDLDPDAPLPEHVTEVPAEGSDFRASLSFRETTVRFARENRLTVRQLIRSFGGYGHPILIGTPEQVADTFEDWYRSGAADGINIMPDVVPEGLAQFVDHVVPILQERGLTRREYGERTLRSRLGAAAGIVPVG